ncbi:hypothetical protein GYO_1795 [Bacillus spizizenii TU-B-10]|uniref:Uncharacterized protein n=1 Tax=Bacillus spizizenii (strain DSM 15029 / JCM 12233 / NBRC 101239 / NRRL B-23049 / TU-B-10) TaxID=1052585 RepID=G4NWP0_BACS4|nr:hypothetical protein GYO_1795 [Bacillus spizizenii TU-B-10]SCV40654.1 hypothetical protein BQ1740_1780 [Bacillus subtilis]
MVICPDFSFFDLISELPHTGTAIAKRPHGFYSRNCQDWGI